MTAWGRAEPGGSEQCGACEGSLEGLRCQRASEGTEKMELLPLAKHLAKENTVFSKLSSF